MIYFDLLYESWINQTTYSQTGQPFICPNPDIRVFPASYTFNMDYGVGTLMKTSTYLGWSLTLECALAPKTQLYLPILTGIKDGVYVLELLTSNFTQLFSKSCLNRHCDPLLICDNKYIVLRECNDSIITVVDSKLSRIIEASDFTVELLAMIPYLEVTISSTSTTEGTVQHPQ